MSLRVGVDIINPARVQRWVQRFPKRVGRLLRDDERGKKLDDARLFAAKEAVVKAVGGLSLFDAHMWAMTPVRGGFAAIPRQRKFEARLIAQRISWVALNCGEAHGSVWALAVAMPHALEGFDAVVTIRPVAALLNAPECLDAESLASVGGKAKPELSRAARHAAIAAAAQLVDAPLKNVGLRSQEDDSLAFYAPAFLQDLPVSIAHEGNYVIGAVARPSMQRQLRVDLGVGVQPFDIS